MLTLEMFSLYAENKIYLLETPSTKWDFKAGLVSLKHLLYICSLPVRFYCTLLLNTASRSYSKLLFKKYSGRE